jgi:hypothetical protein
MRPSPAKRILLVLSVLPLFQACGSAGAGLFRGDQVNIDRDYIYLDDPVFLQTESVYGHRLKGYFAFQLPIFFNADRRDTLRFGPGSGAISANIRALRPTGAEDTAASSGAPSGPGETSRSEGRRRLSCFVDTGRVLMDTAAIGERFKDSAWTLTLTPRRTGSTKVDLNFYCRDYNPLRGRTDTLFLAFQKKRGESEPKDQTMSLPFHVSYRGPLVSILIGLGLLYIFAQVGLIISYS